MKNNRIKTIIILIIVLLVIFFINLIVFSQYDFKLNGNSLIKLNQSDSWDDPLYTINKNKKVTVDGNVKLNEIGTYQIKYTLRVGLFKKTLTREVQILNNWSIADLSLILSGDNPYKLLKGQAYEEPGYVAYDNNTGNISGMVQVTGSVNTNTEGTYTINYRIKNNDGITKSVSRNVIVYEEKNKNEEPVIEENKTEVIQEPENETKIETPITENATNTKFSINPNNFKAQLKTGEYTKTNEIIITINDSNYSHIILPDNKKTTSSKITYTVSQNKVYTFLIYDINNNYVKYNVNITNIDNDPPTGNCKLTLNNNNSIIVVSAKDNIGIKSYKYRYGSNASAETTNTSYTFTATGSTVGQVAIYDKANNTTVINCSVVDNRTNTNPGTENGGDGGNGTVSQQGTYSTLSYNGRRFAFYRPANTSEKLPLLIYFHGSAGLTVGLPQYISNGVNFPYYIAMPINTQDSSYTMSLISYLISQYNIDSSRVFISGASMGTVGALTTVANNPSAFAGVIIVSSYTDTPSTPATSLTRVPMWFFQGKGDSYQMVTNYVNAINNAGGSAKLTSYSGGHDAPLVAFTRADLTNWIFSTRKK